MYRRAGKRMLDLIVAAAGLTVLAPLMALVAAAVKLQDRGPALFRQTRVGREAASFTMLKFRSMPVETPNLASTQSVTLMITPVGRILRRTSFDETPQLWNVVKGDMSIVGPRPALPAQRDLLSLRNASGAACLRPGLTGLAQVNAYDDMPDAEKASWDAEYLRSISLRRDISIIVRTVAYLFKTPPRY